MKKILMLALILFVGIGAYGQSIKKTFGSFIFLREAKTIGVSFTYENMKVGKMTEEKYVKEKIEAYNSKKSGWGDEWHKAWLSDRDERFEPKFIELFSKYLKDSGVSAILGDGEILMKINVDFIEPGFNVGVARRSASIDFTCIFVNKSDGKEIATIVIKDASANNFGGNDYDVGYRVQESFAKGGKELAKYLIKEAKL